MITSKPLIGICLLAAVTMGVGEALAAGGNWKLGRVYSRMVCNSCHKKVGVPISSPNLRTIAEWKAYFAANKHDASGKTTHPYSYYTSQEYRNSIKANNKAAAKFQKLPDDVMLSHMNAWLLHGAKDSDTPARCQ